MISRRGSRLEIEEPYRVFNDAISIHCSDGGGLSVELDDTIIEEIVQLSFGTPEWEEDTDEFVEVSHVPIVVSYGKGWLMIEKGRR